MEGVNPQFGHNKLRQYGYHSVSSTVTADHAMQYCSNGVSGVPAKQRQKESERKREREREKREE